MGTWLLAGGAGYIGSHVLRALLAADERVVVLDDLSTGSRDRVPRGVPFVRASVGDGGTVRRVLEEHCVDGVVHLAAKKSVGESVEDPDRYYAENIGGLVTMLGAMRVAGVTRLVHSSSAAVYGTPTTPAVDEDAPTLPESPYGRTKLMAEWIVRDHAAAYGASVVNLRYFNVVGTAEPALAEVGGTNLFPRVLGRIAEGRPVVVYGGDYPTPDGTPVRDYIHVADLAEAHVAAARLTGTRGVDEVVNIGCGHGYTVLEVLRAFEEVAGTPLPYEVVGRRAGDPASMVAHAGRAGRLLGWRPRHGLDEMVASAWRAADLGSRPAARAVPAA